MSAVARFAALFGYAPMKSRPAQRMPSIRGSIFTGGDTGRLFADWTAGNMSPDQEVRFQFRFLRARARELVRNDPYAAGIVSEYANGVIGPNGMLLQAKVAKRSGDLHDDTNDAIEHAFAEWGDEYCSADGRLTWLDLQWLAAATRRVDGEVFIRRLPGFDNPFGYALQFIDADLVDETYNRAAAPGANEIRMGVEVNGWNRPVAYHVWNCYQSDTARARRVLVRIPAEEIIHLFRQYRPNQTRGVTDFAPVMANLHYLSQFEFSYLQGMRASAAKMGFIKNVSDAALENYKPPAPGEEPRTMEVEPGLITELLPGQEFEAFNPNGVDGAYGAYTSTLLRSVSRGVDMSYSTVTGDLSQANYGSQRGGLLAERDHYRRDQNAMKSKLHRVVYKDWIRSALLRGAVAVDSRLASDYMAVDFDARGFAWIDPKNDIEAAEMEIKLGLNSRTTLCADRGRNFEDVVRDIAQEEDFAAAADVDVSGTQTSASGQPAGQAPATPDATGQSPNDGNGVPRKPSARALQLAGSV